VCSAGPHHCSVFSCVRHSAFLKLAQRVHNNNCFCFVLFNGVWKNWLLIDGGSVVISRQFYCAVFNSIAGPCVLLLPTGTSERFEALRSLKRNVFWSRFSDPGDFLRGLACADVEWLMNTETWRKLGSTFHLHAMPPWWTCYTVWGPYMMPWKQMWTTRSVLFWVHFIVLDLLFSVYLKISESVYFVSMLPCFLKATFFSLMQIIIIIFFSCEKINRYTTCNAEVVHFAK